MTTILAFGDSLTEGFGVSPDYSFASRLEQKLQKKGYPAKVINGGISGDTTYDGLHRMKGLLEHSPDLVILEFGVNDFFSWVSPKNLQNNLEKMIDSFIEINAKVLLAGFLSLKKADGLYEESYHKVYEELSSTKGVPLFPDFLPDIPYNPELTLIDGIHPNEAGIDRIVQDILPYVESLLE